jgi:hypothetical protein
MEHHDRADELEQEADRLEKESERLGQDIEDASSDWEAKKSDTSTPGAASPEGAGPHHLDAEDPATGEAMGEDRDAERDDAVHADAEREDEERVEGD